jgi:hypothetical protein
VADRGQADGPDLYVLHRRLVPVHEVSGLSLWAKASDKLISNNILKEV